MNLNEIKQIMKERKITQKQLSDMTGVPLQTLKYIFTGRTLYPRIDTVEAIEKALGLNQVPISNIDGVRPIKLKRFRMLGEIACGSPIFASEEHETYIDASDDINADFCLTAKGDSMIGARINDGDIVFIKEQSMVENGQIGAVIIGDEVTLKRWYYYPEQKKLVLQAENPRYEPFVFIGEELNNVRCLGRAVLFMSKL